MSQADFCTIGLFEDDPRAPIFADADAERWRFTIEVRAGLKSANGHVCEVNNWHGFGTVFAWIGLKLCE